MNQEEIEAWADELAGSKMDLIELLQTHLQIVQENEDWQKRAGHPIK